MSEIFVVTKQQKEMLLDFLAKVDKEIAPNGTPSKSAAGALGLTGDDVETSVSTYLSSSEIEKLFYLIHVNKLFFLFFTHTHTISIASNLFVYFVITFFRDFQSFGMTPSILLPHFVITPKTMSFLSSLAS